MKIGTKLLLLIATVVSLSALFTGCQTAHGFGEDMENAGNAIQDHVGN